jgi:hypothetical protein
MMMAGMCLCLSMAATANDTKNAGAHTCLSKGAPGDYNPTVAPRKLHELDHSTRVP